jgi:hypothetical protein
MHSGAVIEAMEAATLTAAWTTTDHQNRLKNAAAL